MKAILLLSILLLTGCATLDSVLAEKDPITGELTGRPSNIVRGIQDTVQFIPGWGQLGGTLIGVLSLAYITHRRGKVNVALVEGVEAFRKVLRTTEEGLALDEQFLKLLKEIQEDNGVSKDVFNLVHKHTNVTRK
jgi:hypothetical protein